MTFWVVRANWNKQYFNFVLNSLQQDVNNGGFGEQSQWPWKDSNCSTFPLFFNGSHHYCFTSDKAKSLIDGMWCLNGASNQEKQPISLQSRFYYTMFVQSSMLQLNVDLWRWIQDLPSGSIKNTKVSISALKYYIVKTACFMNIFIWWII